MQSDNKKQVTVLVALSAVLVLAVGFSVKKSLSRNQEQKQAATTTQQDVLPEAKPLATAEVEDIEIPFVGNPPKDPFVPSLNGVSSAQATPNKIFAPPAPAAPRSQGARVASLPRMNNVPPLPLPGLGPNVRVESPEGGTPAEVSGPPFRATGMVRGSYDIAILRGEGGGRYFVREGQSVGDGYVVKSISPVGVVLKNQNRSTFLKLGGAQDARSLERPRQEGN